VPSRESPGSGKARRAAVTFAARFTGPRLSLVQSNPRPAVPAPASLAGGAVRLVVSIPTDRVGLAEPLLSTGVTGRGDLIYIRYLDRQHVRFGYDHWGVGAGESPSVPYDGRELHAIELVNGALRGDTEGPARMEIRLDGISVWELSTATYATRPTDIAFGQNPHREFKQPAKVHRADLRHRPGAAFVAEKQDRKPADRDPNFQMMKWVLALICATLIAGFVYWQRQGVKVSYVNGLTAYNALPNREYIFQRDCYLFKLDDRPSSWPYVGDHSVVASLPTEVDPKHLNIAHPAGRIVDVVRTGSRFKLVSVRRDESRHGTSISFELLFTDEDQRKYPRIDAYFIMDHAPEARGEAPSLLPAYAVERVKY